MKSNMSLTLPRWFGRKTQKKIEKQNDENLEENAKPHNSSGIAHEHFEGPILYFEEKDSQCEDINNCDGFTRQQKERAKYVQEQHTISKHVTCRLLGDQTLNHKVGNETVNYENSENISSTYPFAEQDLENKTNHTIYGGR